MLPATYEAFLDRKDAGEQLAAALAGLRGARPLVLAIPRGGVAVGRVVADHLEGDLDVVLVRKLGAPGNEEFAVGAIDESGHVEIGAEAGQLGLGDAYLSREASRQFARIEQRRRLYSPHRGAHDPKGRIVVVVDDGLATGATMRAALTATRRHGPARLIAAVPVASADRIPSIRALADEVVCLSVPRQFRSVGEHYLSFPAVEDAEVIQMLKPAGQPAAAPFVSGMRFAVDGAVLEGDLHVPADARGCVVFVHGSGSSRHSTRNKHVARTLEDRGFATLLFDLLSPDEDTTYSERFDIAKLARRLDGVLNRLADEPHVANLPVGLFGASTGAAAAMSVAAHRDDIRAVVSRGGRPDLAGAVALAEVGAPTLFIVGGADTQVIALNRQALAAVTGVGELRLVPNATHLFEEHGALEQVAAMAGDWFARWLPQG
ncbi:phosphoribosyltransferase family protein [Luteibacter sp. Lutesp34]|uniref:phosphoribosyltransferase family protein n=1 Tax=Luteibacter sp. Lutesp34 TaxID=3243030 RepID=UPI0039B5E7F2